MYKMGNFDVRGQPFKLDNDGYYNICINSLEIMDEDNFLYQSYFESVNILLDYMIENIKNGTSEGIIFPILYLCRHYFELAIKSILSRLNEKKIIDIKVKKNHEIKKEWLQCLAEECEKHCKKEIPDEFFRFAEAINFIDPKGDYFKYSMDNKGKYFRKDGSEEEDIRSTYNIGIIPLKEDLKKINAFFNDLEEVLL